MAQIGIILYLWILIRTFKLVPTLYRYASAIIKQSNSLASAQNRHKLSEKAQKRAIDIKEFLTTHDLVLKSMLVEFQEAQSFFMIACQAATLAGMRYNTILDATNLVMVWADRALSGMVAAGGILPIILGLWTLQKMHMCSPWIFFLSTITLIVSELTIYETLYWPAPKNVTPLGGSWPQSCGEHPPPLIYCGNPNFVGFMGGPFVFLNFVNPICLTHYGILLILWVRPFAERILQSDKVVNSSPRIPRFYSHVKDLWKLRWVKWVHHILTVITELLNITSAALYVYCFSSLYQSGFIDWGNWGFGQLIALTMWAPVLSKYFYWTICEYIYAFPI